MIPTARPAPGRPTGRLARAAAGLAALIVLASWITGLPALLWHVGGYPIPTSLPSIDGILKALTRPDDGTLLMQLLVVAGWLVWVTFCISMVIEIAGRVAGRQLSAPPGLRTQRRMAGLLIGALAALAAPTAAHAGQEPASPAAATSTLDPPTSKPATSGDTAPQPGHVLHLVARGEGLLDLQDRYGVEWKQIAQANYGTVQPDGKSLQPGQTRIYPGWQIRVPTAHPPTAGGATLAANDQQPDDQPDHTQQQVVYEVAQGDWLWHIADRVLGDPDRYREIAELNPQYTGRHSSHPPGHPNRLMFPDYIEPGWRLTLPSDADDQGPRRHGTGTVHTPDEQDEQEPETTGPTPEPPPVTPTQPASPPAPDGPAPPPPPPPETTAPTPEAPTQAPPTTAPPTPVTPAPPANEPSRPAPTAAATTSQPTTHETASPAAPPPRDDTDDEDDSGQGVHLPIAFGAALIAAALGVTAAIKLRRRGTSGDPRVDRPGHRPGHRPQRVDHGKVDQKLQVAAQPLDVDRLDTALRTLAVGLVHRTGELPDIIGAHVEAGSIHLLLTAPAGPADPPWHAAGTQWSLPAGPDPPLAADGALAALPTLVTIGRQTSHNGALTGGEHLLLDLERLGCLAIGGHPDVGRDLMRYIASELAMNSWSDDVEVILAGWPDHETRLLSALNPNRIRPNASTREAVARLRQRVAIAAGTLADAGAADALHGRVNDLAGDSWMPIVLLAADPQPDDLAAIGGLAADLARVGRCAIAAVTTGDIPASGDQPDAVHTITVTADRAVTVPFLGTTLAAAGLPLHELEPLARVIGNARDGQEEPVPPAPEPEPWAAGTDAAGGLLRNDYPSQQPAPIPETPEPEGTDTGFIDTLDLLDHFQHADEAAEAADSTPPADTRQAPPGHHQPAQLTVPAAAHQLAVEQRGDSELDADLDAWRASVPDRPRIRVLGPVTDAHHVINAPGEPPKPGRLLLLAEVLVYLAQRGRRGADPRHLDEDLWPGQDVKVTYRRATISRARQWAGRRGDGGPWLAEIHYRLEDGYLLDWHLFRRLRTRGQARAPAGDADLRAALDLVHGQPLEGYERIAATTRSPYSWLPTSDIDPDHLVAAVVDTAHELAQLYLAEGDTAGARWAVQQAWLTDPDRNYDQPWQDLLAAQAADGHGAELTATVRDLMRIREAEVEEDLNPAIYSLLQDILPSGYWDSDLQPAASA